NRSSFPACSMKDLAGATPDPEPSQPPPRHAEHAHEPTVGGKPEPRATELLIAMESELHEPSDQVREPAIVTATVGSSVEREYAEDSITHCTTAEGELNLDLRQNLKPSNSHPISTLPPLSPFNPSAHPQLTICAVGSPRVCQSPLVSWLEDPSSSPQPQSPGLRLGPPALRLHPVSPPAPPGSIVPPAPPRSVVSPPLPQDSTLVAPAPPWTSGSPPPSWSPEPWVPPWPSGSSVSPRIIGSPSPPRALPPPAPPPSVGPRESSACPPSAPPWVIMAAFWVRLGSSCFRFLLSPPWLLPPSSPPWTIPSPPWTPFALLPGVRPPKPPPKT
ncbi:hypothetical protein M9458_039144, partial [Cirrhinus mrigala]